MKRKIQGKKIKKEEEEKRAAKNGSFGFLFYLNRAIICLDNRNKK